MSNQNRVQAGVPRGGQFDNAVHAESDVLLASPAQPTPSSDLASTIDRIRRRQAERREFAEQGPDGDDWESYDEARADDNEDAVADLDELLRALENRPADGYGTVSSGDGETRVSGGFGEVTVSERDPESGPGTFIDVDTSGQTDGQPVTVMINDKVIRIPLEDDSIDDDPRCDDCGRYLDDCCCANRGITAESSINEIDDALEQSYKDLATGAPGAEPVNQRLSALATARVIKDADPDARYVDLDWDADGYLKPIRVIDSFLDERGDAASDAANVATTYISNLESGQDNYLDCLTRMPDGSQRLRLDGALGRQ